VVHLDGQAGFSGEKGGVQGDVADVAAGHVELGEALDVQFAGWGLWGKDALPDGFALGYAGKGKIDSETQAALKGLVHGGLEIRGEDGEPLKVFHALQQIADLDVGVAVMAVPGLGTLAEQSVALVEEQQDAAFLGSVEDLLEILFGFTDVLAHHGGEIDAVEV
jgi:hypothetical protein